MEIQCSLCRMGPSDQEASSIAHLSVAATYSEERSISRVIRRSYREEGIHLSIAVGEGGCLLIQLNDSEEGIQLSRNIQRS